MTFDITSSADLARLLNESTPATAEDAAETPLDWPAIWAYGETYELDTAIATETFAALKDGTAAVRFKPAGEDCWGLDNPCGHLPGHPGERRLAHWMPADTDTWTANEDARGVDRDWRAVTVWDANGFTETQVHASLEAAKEAFDREVADLTELTARLDAEAAAF